MKEEITIKGMHCASCEKTIKRALEKEGIIVESISHKSGKATVEHSTSKRRINQALSKKGYALEGETTAQQEGIETKIIANGSLTLAILLIIQVALIFTIYKSLPGYADRYFLPFLYVPIVIVANMLALWHQRAYSKEASCMTGMMVGMTIGMTTGFTVGAIVGLVNGMFIGSVVGTFIGIIAGVYAGKCCGIMGIMEGMMAGLMSGTMGAMLTVMMVADHVQIFLPILILICIAILIGMMRMTYEEKADKEAQPWPLALVLGVSLITMLLINAIMLFAPKGFY